MTQILTFYLLLSCSDNTVARRSPTGSVSSESVEADDTATSPAANPVRTSLCK